ncbi:MAG: LysR family transcriptional regulator [Ktedonobacteraceae bacterium]
MKHIDGHLDLTFHQLSLFRAVAQHLSYTHAAEQLYLSQPAVSQQVKALERQLGLRLFARQGRGIILTPAGQELLHHAKRLLTLFAGIVPVVQQIHQIERGSVFIGSSTSAGTYIVPALLGAFHAHYPGIHITLTVVNRYAIEEYLLSHHIDLVVMSQIEHQERFIIEHLAPYELAVVANPFHPLVKRKGLTLSDLQEETLLLREQGAGTRHDTEQYLEKEGVALRGNLELGSIEAIKESVIAGLGISVLALDSLVHEIARGDLVVLDVKGFPLHRHWYLVRLKGKRMSLAAEALRHFLLQEGPKVFHPQ